MGCLLCKNKDAREIPAEEAAKDGAYFHIECPSCGKYKLTYWAAASYFNDMSDKQRNVLHKNIKSWLKANQDTKFIDSDVIKAALAGAVNSSDF